MARAIPAARHSARRAAVAVVVLLAWATLATVRAAPLPADIQALALSFFPDADTIPSHFRIFDRLRRHKECGRPRQICAIECPSQAIHPSGEIDANECHYCLDRQVTY